MSFVTNLVLQRLKTHMTSKMITAVSSSDPSRADMVKIGRFQDDPRTNNIYLAISGGSQSDPELIDGIVSLKEFDHIGMVLPPREVGGGQLWWRRGEIKIGCFFLDGKVVEEKAAEYGYEVLGRVMANVETCRVSDISDSYGEHALAIFCFASNFMESGGPPTSYIWRGSVKWQLLTERR